MTKKIEKDNRVKSSLITGQWSPTVEALQKKLAGLPMKDVDRMEFEKYIDYITVKNFAFDVDKLIKSHIVDSLKGTDRKLMSYMADLANTQHLLAEVDKEVTFHRMVILDLKQEYLDEQDVGEKAKIYLAIQEAEKSVDLYSRRIQKYIELRNKIRAEIDKGNYQKKAIELKEDESRARGDRALPVDFKVMDDVL